MKDISLNVDEFSLVVTLMSIIIRCGPCKLMMPIFKSLAEEYPEDVVKLVKVDTDLHEDAVEKYNIQGVPMFGVFKDGDLLVSYSGAMTKDKLRDFINKNTQAQVQT